MAQYRNDLLQSTRELDPRVLHIFESHEAGYKLWNLRFHFRKKFQVPLEKCRDLPLLKHKPQHWQHPCLQACRELQTLHTNKGWILTNVQKLPRTWLNNISRHPIPFSPFDSNSGVTNMRPEVLGAFLKHHLQTNRRGQTVQLPANTTWPPSYLCSHIVPLLKVSTVVTALAVSAGNTNTESRAGRYCFSRHIG